MNYLSARQRQSDKKWDYTQKNDGAIWPIGYCSGWNEYTPEERERYFMTDKWWEEQLQHKAKFHSDGHATAEEARECYKRYELDHNMRVTENSHAKHQCQVCQEWTQTMVIIGGYTTFDLCETHATREEVEKLYNVGESWES